MNKKLKNRILSLFMAMVMLLSLGVSVYAVPTETAAVKFNGEMLQMDIPAYAEGDTAMLPVRSIMEYAGCSVTWIETPKGALIQKEGTVAVVYVDKNVYDLNSEQKQSAVAATLYSGSLYCDMATVAEILGMTYEYDAVTKIVALSDGTAVDENSGYVDILAYEDTYVRDGAGNKDSNFGTAKTIEAKGILGDTNRLIYLKFDISSLTPEMVGKANLNLTGNRATTENPDANLEYFFNEVDPNSWSETKLTFATQPEMGEQFCVKRSTWTNSMDFNITDYIKKSVQEGKKQISFVIWGHPEEGLRLGFNSRESGTGPHLRIDSDPSNYQTELPTMEGFGEGQDPWEWAKKMVAESKAEKLERHETENLERISKSSYRLTPTDDTYANAGKYSMSNFGDLTTMESKCGPDTADSARVAYIKYDISQLPEGDVAYAYLKLWCTMLESNVMHDEEVRVVDNNWSEKSLTWNNRPAAQSTVAGTSYITQVSEWFSFDITEAVREAKAKGETEISLEITDTVVRRTAFATKESSYPPRLEVCIDDGSREFMSAQGNDPKEYSLIVNNINNGNRSQTFPNQTRSLETLSGYKMTADKPQLSKYGGRLDMQTDATGNYYVKQIDGRWWIIDPEGYPMINMGVAVVVPLYGAGPLGKAGFAREFGTQENWAEKTSSYLKNDLYFNGVGGWSEVDLLHDTTDGSYMAMTQIQYFMRTYMSEIGINFIANGGSFFEGGALNVFDPDFVTFCDRFAAENIAPKKDWKNFMGWMTDNELQSDLTMLDNFLKLDWREPRNAYTYATAWTYLKDYTGKDNPSLDDVDDIMREDFLEFMWDRYHAVVSAAVRKYDPNHMYLGIRAVEDAWLKRGFWAASGRYCDIICLNYYHNWTPDRAMMTNWSEWSNNRPFLVTEWYAMGMDSGMGNSSGAGYLVATQQDRARFYQNFVLKLMETKNCVGFHWFTYLDNDPSGSSGDSSNIDSNKGIISVNTYKPYTDLVNEMAELNRQAYPLIDYFDARNGK